MAIKRGGCGTTEDPGYLSDESDFYGNKGTKSSLEARTASFSPIRWWIYRTPTLMELAVENLSKLATKQTIKLHNPYEGLLYARQLTETVDDFLERLPPATTEASDIIPWIFIANPHHEGAAESTASLRNQDLEGPPDERSDWPRFTVLAGKLLEELLIVTKDIERKNEGKAKSAITRAVNAQKGKIVKKILDAAIENNCTSGKWMIFAAPDEVNAVWGAIAKATANNELGIAAKVAPDSGERRKERLICIYTPDFNDMQDVTRVAQKLKDIGVIDGRDRGIYYKCGQHIVSKDEFLCGIG